MAPLPEKLYRGFERTIIFTLIVVLSAMVLMGTISLLMLLVYNAGPRLREVTNTEVLQQVMQRGFGGALVVLLGLELIDTLKKFSAEHHVRVEVVFLVGMIAVGRHVIQIDYAHASMA